MRPDEIREAAIDSDQPAPAPAPEAMPPTRIASVHKSEARSGSDGQTKQRYTTTMKDLVAAGVLPAGSVLRKTYCAMHYEVVVRTDGMLEAEGDIFGSQQRRPAA